MTDELVEVIARALAVAKGIEICSDAQYRHSSFGITAHALSPIIERLQIEAAKRMQDHIGNMTCACFDCIDSLDPATIIGELH